MERDLTFPQIVDGLSAPIATTTSDGQVEFANRQFLDYLGVSLEELKSWETSGVVHPDDLARVVTTWRQSLEPGEPFEIELRVRRAGGSFAWVRVRGLPLRDTEGRIVHWCMLLADVAARKRAEAILDGEKRLLEMVATGSPLEDVLQAMCGIVDGVTANSACSILLIDSNGTFCHGAGPALPPGYNDAIKGVPVAAEAGPCGTAASSRQQVVVLDLASEPRWVGQGWRTLALEHGLRSVCSTPIVSLTGAVLGTFAIYQRRPEPPIASLTDIITRFTHVASIAIERRHSERELQERERESRLILDSIPGMVALLTASGEVEVVNPQLTEYFGQTVEQLRQWRMTDTIHPEDLPHVIEVFTRSIAAGSPYEIVQRFRRSDGEYRWFLNCGLPVRDPRGQIARWCVLLTDIDERKRAEDALRASEQSLQLIIDTIPALAWSARPDGSAEFFNRHYLDFIGLSAEQANGWGWTAAVHAEDLNELSSTWQRIIASNAAGEAEARLRRQDGNYRWFLLRANPLRNESGVIVKWYGVNTDIDERKKVEEALRSSERNLSQMINAIPTFLQVSRADGTVLSMNQTVLDYHGVSLQEVQKEDFRSRFYHPDDAERLREMRNAALKRPLPFEYEQRALGKDGRYRWFMVRYNPLLDEQGRIDRWYAAAFDIEDRKHAEAELRRAYDSFADAQGLSKTGGFITDLVGDDHNWSEETFRIFGFELGTKVTMERIRPLIHPDDRPSFESMIARAMSGANVTFSFRILTEDTGAVKYLRGTAHVVEKIEGRPMFVGAIQDVTESKMAEEALDRARSELARVARVTAVSAFTASIAHEVNQPLSGIITNAGTCLRMLAAHPPDVDGARETAKRTLRDGNRASDVITRLRVLFSKREFTLEPLDVNEIAQEVVALSLSELQRNRMVLRSEFGADLPAIIGDRIQLQQVILNLLRNASDAMLSVHDRPRQLLIATEHEADNRVRLSVRDVGVGLDSQTMDKLFDAFYTTKVDGMGIGLSVSRSIIERHHGRLWAEPNDGRGATFAFAIPAASERAVRATDTKV
jgi:PAS domain S-box-containing protein